nr:PREDICTED: intestinal mucin-like protein [Anolis carolinensis]|eukprot:XP_016848978.1 PREDICTED: intestinal mucin-like protein [Anolis carolinensis]
MCMKCKLMFGEKVKNTHSHFSLPCRPTEDISVHVSEGCFCSDDKILFNSYTDICVSECGCVGPDGLPKLPGSTWKSNCQECICDPLSVTVQCKPQTCETTETPACEKEGFIAVHVVTPEDPCCPEIQCSTFLSSQDQLVALVQVLLSVIQGLINRTSLNKK